MKHRVGRRCVAVLAAVLGLAGLIGLGTPAAAEEAGAIKYPYSVSVDGQEKETDSKLQVATFTYGDGSGDSVTNTITIKNTDLDGELSANVFFSGYHAGDQVAGFTLSDNNVSGIKKNESKNVTITFNPSGLNADMHRATLWVRPTNEEKNADMKLWGILLEAKVDPKSVGVVSISAVERVDGSTTNPNDVTCKLSDGSQHTMQELGLESEGLTKNAAGQTKAYAVRQSRVGNYQITGEIPDLPVTVAPKASANGSQSGGNSSGSQHGGSNRPSTNMPTQANPNLKITGGSFPYDGKRHAASVSFSGTGNHRVTYTDSHGQSVDTPRAAGTYTAHVELEATPNYYSASADATITIRPKLISIVSNGDAVPNKEYDGTINATVNTSALSLSGVLSGDNVTLNPGTITATFGSAGIGDRLVTIQLPNASLTGTDAGSYSLSNTMLNEYATITQGSVHVTFTGDLTKEYGQTFTFNSSHYRASNGQQITLTSTGAPANATVGTHDISATGVGANYRVIVNNNAKLEVVQATPQLSKADAGSGQEGASLSTVTPNVSYINPHSHQAVAGTVRWTDPNQKLGAAGTSASYSYTFTPSDTLNYKPVTGSVSVEATKQPPVAISVANTTATYDGLAHPVSVTTNPAGAKVTITYGSSSSAPTAAGTHPFTVTAQASGYASNTVEGTLTISQVSPTGQPKVSGSGATLSSYKLDASTITGVNGKPVLGTIAWDDPATTSVKEGDKYGWTFTPSDASYTKATGTIIPNPLVIVDTSQLQSAIAQATQLRGQAMVSANGQDVEPAKKWVTADVDEFLVKAIESANSCLTEGGATQFMVDDALATLTSATSSYCTSMQAGLKGTGQVAAQKKPSTITLVPNQVSLKPGGDPATVKVGGQGSGSLIAFSSNDDVAMASVSGNTVTVTAISEGTAVVTIARSATGEFEQCEATLPVVVGEAPADYVPPTDLNNVEDEGTLPADPTTPNVDDPGANDPVPTNETVRVYNPYSHEHLFVSKNEASNLVALGWNDEGTAKTPKTSNTPVYRLRNPWNNDDHHYTTDKNEYDELQEKGWVGEGIQFYSDDNQGVAVHRLFNPYETGIGSHLYTSNEEEYNTLVAAGWTDEGEGWYYLAA